MHRLSLIFALVLFGFIQVQAQSPHGETFKIDRTTCHEHDDQSQVNNDHSQVSGYSYNSAACLNCHPQEN